MDDLQDFENKYQNERLFIIGNGPSLNKTPLKKLNNEHTLAMNKINRIYNLTSWRPSFYYFANSSTHSFSEQILENISLGIPCFINSENGEIINKYENAYGFDRFSLSSADIWDSATISEIKEMPIQQLLHFWSDDPTHHLYHYHTMYGATQLATYMGFDKIYFVGCDLGQEYRNPHMIFNSGLDPHRYSGTKVSYALDSIKKDYYKSLFNGLSYLVFQKLEDLQTSANYGSRYINKNKNDHFESNYLNDRYIHDGPQHELEITKAHIATHRICNNKGIETYNATVGGSLEVYPRVSIDEVIDK